MKEFIDIRNDISDSFEGSYDRNKLCLDDIEFAFVEGAMWKGSLAGQSSGQNLAKQFKNKPRPEVNKIFASINRVLGQKQRLEMNAKITSNSDEATDEDAKLLQSRWRNDFQSSDGVEAVDNSDFEAFYGGFGAIKVVSKYEDEENPDQEHQYLCLEPILSAPSSVAFGPSVRKDKSDAKWCVQLVRTSRKSVEDEYGVDIPSFNQQVNWFDWNTDTEKDTYLAHYYEVVTKNLTVYDFEGFRITAGDGIKDDQGNKVSREDLNDLRNENKHSVTKKKVKRVEYALLSGDGFLIKPRLTAFKRIPIIPQYGYYSVINGIEYYCGEVRKRRDPQMFLNTFYSSMMEIMAAPQVEKPEYAPEQIARHKDQRKRADIDGAAFVLSDPIKDLNGSPIHFGPIGSQKPPEMGSGLATAGQMLDNSLVEMAGTGQSTVPSNTSADAIKQVNERQDDTYQILMQNSMATIKSACKCWIDAAQAYYFTKPRKLRVVAADGSQSQVETMQYEMSEGGDYGQYKNSARGRYSVQVKAGESYKSKKEAELETTLKMLQFTDTQAPQGQLLMNQAITLTTGEGGDRSRKVANYMIIDSMLALGLDPEAETEEEKAYVQQKMEQMQAAQQEQQLDAAMVMAQAEMLKGQADMLEQQNRQAEIQLKSEKVQQEGYKVILAEEKQRSDIANTNADTVKKISETEKITGETFSNQLNDFVSIQPIKTA